MIITYNIMLNTGCIFIAFIVRAVHIIYTYRTNIPITYYMPIHTHTLHRDILKILQNFESIE